MTVQSGNTNQRNEKRGFSMTRLQAAWHQVRPSGPQIVFLSIFFVMAFFIGWKTLNDSDTGFHIRAGQYIIDHHKLPTGETIFGGSAPLPWTAHEWLAEIFMGATYNVFGLTGVAMIFSTVIAVFYALLYMRIRKSGVHVGFACALLTIMIGATHWHWLARPHVFSWLLFFALHEVLEVHRRGENKILLWALPITALWVNIHAGWIAGGALLGVYLFADLMQATDKRIRIELRAPIIARSKRLALVAVGCGAALLLNPLGLKMITFPFEFLSDPRWSSSVVEYLSPNFQKVGDAPIGYLIIGIIALLAVSRKGAFEIVDLITLSLFTYLALYSVRNVHFLCVIASVSIAQVAGSVFPENIMLSGKHRKKDKEAETSQSDSNASRWHIFPAVLVILVFCMILSGQIRYDFDTESKPVGSAEFLRKHPLKGNIFCGVQDGSYLNYATNGGIKTFIDGRMDAFGIDRFMDARKIANAEPGWEDIAKKYRIDYVLVSAWYFLSKELESHPGWRLVFDDGASRIFIRKGSAADLSSRLPSVIPREISLNKTKTVAQFFTIRSPLVRRIMTGTWN